MVYFMYSDKVFYHATRHTLHNLVLSVSRCPTLALRICCNKDVWFVLYTWHVITM